MGNSQHCLGTHGDFYPGDYVHYSDDTSNRFECHGNYSSGNCFSTTSAAVLTAPGHYEGNVLMIG